MAKNLLRIFALLIAGGQACLAQTPSPTTSFTCLNPNVASSSSSALPPVLPPTSTSSIPACSRVLNVNIHYILRADGSGNFNEVSDQTPYTLWSDRVGIPPYVVHPANTARNGYAWAKGIVADMNGLWADNPPQWGSYGQVATPAKKIRVTLNGVYFHRVSASEYFVDNDNTSPTYFASIFVPGTGTPDPILFDRYGVAKDSVLNLIVAPNYAGPSVSIGGVARGFGIDPTIPRANWVKAFNSFAYYRWRRENDGNPNIIPGYAIPDNSRSATANTFCHELGHLFGLIHPFEGGNRCTDLNTNSGRCNGGNLMSYCDAVGNALSPCQLGTAHANLVNPNTAGTNDYTRYQSRSVSACDVVPTRAFFTLSSCTGNPRMVFMDSRGTFNARTVVINVYDTNLNLLVSRLTRAQPSGRWNIGQLLTLSPTTNYWVELMAYGGAGAGTSHRSRRLMRVNALPDACIAIANTPN